MVLKTKILEKIPESEHNEPFLTVLLDYAQRRNVESKEHLLDLLEREINLTESSNDVQGKNLKEQSFKIEMLKESRSKLLKYLF
jgi:hypothetical protein